MEDYKRILTVQDISCLGQCSLTVALPIISACKAETCIIPSAVLSTHTGGFKNYTLKDLTEEIPLIARHWKSENICFDYIYTGYLGSAKQIGYVTDIADTLLKRGGKLIADPAMADNGKLYPGFDMDFVKEMTKLCRRADIILPNLTEACLLTGTEYKEVYDEDYIDGILKSFSAMGVKTVIFTGVGYTPDTTGVLVYKDGEKRYYASAFVGALSRGRSEYEAAVIAADYTVKCIEYSQGDETHKYGVKFEPLLKELITAIE